MSTDMNPNLTPALNKMRRLGYNLWGLFASGPLYLLAERLQKRDISSKLRVLRAEAARPFAVRKAAALSRLGDTLEQAGNTVPYYRDLFASCRFDPAKARKDSRYLEDLPFLTKDILREQGKRLVSEVYSDRLTREQKTGSSTGPAAIIYYDQQSLDWTAAQNILMLTWAGKRRYNREVHLSTRFPTPPPPEALRFETRKCLVLNRRNIYTEGFSDAAQARLLTDLHKAHAHVVQGHPSNLFALARRLKKLGLDGAGLFEIFVSTGEMITPAQRQLIEEVFQARVSNRYGACEFGVMAQELAQGSKGALLVSDSLVWPELFAPDADGTGELVFTSLRNPAMPLIRYRMGDLGRLEERPDGETTGWVITQITGRSHDNVEIDGVVYPTHYIQDILDRCGNITDFQILVQEGQAREFRLVAEEGAWESISSAVRTNFPSVPLRRIGLEDLIFVGVRGKFSYLLQEAS